MECAVYIAVSVDGFIARPDGGLDWLKAVERAGEDYGYAAFAADIDVFLMGRATYDVVRALGEATWPFAGKRVVVVTHRALEGAPAGVESIAGTPAEIVASLAKSGAKRAYVDGGVVIRAFLAAGLVDEVTLSVIPVLLGEGIPLFGGVAASLTLASAQSFPSGLVQLRYRTVPRAP